MASSIVPIAELRHLFTAVSNHGNQHLVEVEADLMQTNFLLSEAIEKLSNSFMSLHQAVTEQQAAIDGLLKPFNLPSEQLDEVARYSEKIGQEVNSAVTGLQFQDMTSQLIHRISKRIGGLKESLNALAEHGEGMETDHEHEDIMRLLQEMNAHLSTRDDQLRAGIRKSVAQRDMDSGDIELF